MIAYPLLCLKGDIHERFQCSETERGAVVPGSGLFLERALKNVVAKNRPFSLTFFQIVALMFPHRNLVAGRLDEVLVAMMFLFCVPST